MRCPVATKDVSQILDRAAPRNIPDRPTNSGRYADRCLYHNIAEQIFPKHSNQSYAREAIEQLDDLQIRSPSVKFKPILHKFSARPWGSAEVKLKIYNGTDVSGLSQEYPYFIGLPAHTFKGYSVDTLEDGYLLKINSANAVDIRRATEELLAEIDRVARDRDNVEWINHDTYADSYARAMDGSTIQVHEDILEFLNTNSPCIKTTIRDSVSEDHGHHPKIVNLALVDLTMAGEVVYNHDTDQYTI